jgi:hypothetical protein
MSKSGQLHTLATLPEGKNPLGILWALELFHQFRKEKKSLNPARNLMTSSWFSPFSTLS